MVGFKDITISEENISALPDDGIPDDFRTFIDDSVSTPIINVGPMDFVDTDCKEEDVFIEDEDEEIEEIEDNIAHSVIPNPGKKLLQTEQIKNIIDWPGRNVYPVNEFATDNLASKCFPTLFANGKGDPTNPIRNTSIKFSNAVTHLLKYAYKKSNGEWYYPFAAHPRFAFWALNMLQRRRAIAQANRCLILNEKYHEYTVEDIKSMLQDKDKFPNFISKLHLHTKNVTG